MKALARAVVDAMAFIELSEPPTVDEDAAVAALEMLAADLRQCTEKEKSALRDVVAEYAAGSRGAKRRFYDSFMVNAGLDAPDDALSRRPARPRTKAVVGSTADSKLLRRQLDFTRSSGDPKVVARLLDRSPALANAAFADRSRPMHHAAMWGYDRIIELLLARGAEVNVRDRTGTTPLHWAAVNGHRRACELLLAAGAEVNALDGEGRTPLAAAEEFVPENVARVRRMLKRHGGRLR